MQQKSSFPQNFGYMNGYTYLLLSLCQWSLRIGEHDVSKLVQQLLLILVQVAQRSTHWCTTHFFRFWLLVWIGLIGFHTGSVLFDFKSFLVIRREFSVSFVLAWSVSKRSFVWSGVNWAHCPLARFRGNRNFSYCVGGFFCGQPSRRVRENCFWKTSVTMNRFCSVVLDVSIPMLMMGRSSKQTLPTWWPRDEWIASNPSRHPTVVIAFSKMLPESE